MESARNVSKVYEDDSYNPAKFFSNRLLAFASICGGYDAISGITTMDIDGKSLELDYSLTVYNNNSASNSFRISAFERYRRSAVESNSQTEVFLTVKLFKKIYLL